MGRIEPKLGGGEDIMTDTVIVGLISAGGTVLTAITALILNYRLFNSLERRMEVIDLARDAIPVRRPYCAVCGIA